MYLNSPHRRISIKTFFIGLCWLDKKYQKFQCKRLFYRTKFSQAAFEMLQGKIQKYKNMKCLEIYCDIRYQSRAHTFWDTLYDSPIFSVFPSVILLIVHVCEGCIFVFGFSIFSLIIEISAPVSTINLQRVSAISILTVQK